MLLFLLGKELKYREILAYLLFMMYFIFLSYFVDVQYFYIKSNAYKIRSHTISLIIYH
jgi:hypothetical protein